MTAVTTHSHPLGRRTGALLIGVAFAAALGAGASVVLDERSEPAPTSVVAEDTTTELRSANAAEHRIELDSSQGPTSANAAEHKLLGR